jgi:signal transduction histidine kinase
MTSPRLESRILLLIISFASLIILVFSGIGWLILLDAEDAIHDRYFSQTAADIAAGKIGPDLPKGISAHADTDFLKSKMQLRKIPSAPGLHEIFANDELTRSEVIRTFSDRLRLWLFLGYEREFRLWIAPQDSVGNKRVVLADLSVLEVSEQETTRAGERMLILSALFFLIALGVSQLITRWALKPVRVLTRRVLHDPGEVGASRLPLEFPEDEIGRLASALDDYRHRLGKAISRERHFLSDCSHELRTPIATMKSALDLLEQTAEPMARERISGRIRRSAQRMERLVQTFLLLAREQKPPASAVALDVRKLICHVASEIRSLHPDHPMEISILDNGEVMLEADAEILTVLCHNLIGNAFQHAGGGLLEISIHSDSQSMSLVFQDDGQGFPELPGPASPGNYGIGLSLVTRLCETCGWCFGRSPSPTGGARLEVRIPKKVKHHPFLRPPVRIIGSFRGLPQKANS